MKYNINDRVVVSGDSADLWIKDYNIRVSTYGTVLEKTEAKDKKILVRLDSIDGENDVVCYVRKSHIRPFGMFAIRVYKECYSFDNYDDFIYRHNESDVNFGDLMVNEVYCSENRLVDGWRRLLTDWEGWTYCVKDLINDEVITGGVFDPSDIEYIEGYIKEAL